MTAQHHQKMTLIVLLFVLITVTLLAAAPVNAASNSAESSYTCKPSWGLRCFEVDADGARVKNGRTLWRGTSIPATKIDDVVVQARNRRYYRLNNFTTE